MRKRDKWGVERRFRKVARRERWKNTTFSIIFMWIKGMVVIAEMIAILAGMYYFSKWLTGLTDKARMRVLWGIVIGFLLVVLPIALGILATINTNVKSFLKRTVK